MKRLLLTLALLTFCVSTSAQTGGATQLAHGTLAQRPATCKVSRGEVYYQTDTSGEGVGSYECGPADNQWRKVGAQTLDQLTDVTVSSPASGHALVFNGSLFINRPLVKADVGLPLVDNTSDASKPVSTAQQAALDLKASASALTSEASTRANADTTLQTNIDAEASARASAITSASTADRARSNHTGTQTASTVSDFNAAALAAAPAETAMTVGTLISGATGKTTLADADSVGLSDSAASNVLKKLTLANLKATFKTYFDTIYQAALGLTTDGTTVTVPNNLTVDGQLTIFNADVSGSIDGTQAGFDNISASTILTAAMIETGTVVRPVTGQAGAPTATIGDAAHPYSSVYVGGAANHSARITGTFAADRTITVPDEDGTLATKGYVDAGLAGKANTSHNHAASDINSGTLAAARMPALTGDVTTSAGAVAATIANNAVSNAKLAQMAAHTFKGNNTGSTANPLDLTAAQLKADLAISTSDVSGLGTMAAQAEANYALLAGRSGGQTLSGGTAASENLTLQSTNHATKGYILVGTGGLVGVNKSTPGAQFHVVASAAGTKGLIVQMAASPSANPLEVQDSTGAAKLSVGVTGVLTATGVVGGNDGVRITTVGDLAIYNGGKFGWSGTSSSSGALDVSLTRNAAAVLQIGDGGANANGTLLAAKVYPNPTFTASGTTGAQTINKQVFSVNFAASAASLVVTNSFVTATSGLVCTVNANDTTMKSAAAVPASGSVTLYPNTAPTAETKVTCQVFN